MGKYTLVTLRYQYIKLNVGNMLKMMSYNLKDIAITVQDFISFSTFGIGDAFWQTKEEIICILVIKRS